MLFLLNNVTPYVTPLVTPLHFYTSLWVIAAHKKTALLRSRFNAWYCMAVNSVMPLKWACLACCVG